jgi:hypothetical protein
LNSLRDITRWTDGKADMDALIIFTIFMTRKEVLPIQQAGFKNRHLNKLSCSQTQDYCGSNEINERCKGELFLAIPVSILASLVTLSNCDVGYPERLEHTFSR